MAAARSEAAEVAVADVDGLAGDGERVTRLGRATGSERMGAGDGIGTVVPLGPSIWKS